MIGDIEKELGEQPVQLTYHVRALHTSGKYAGRLIGHSSTHDKRHRPVSLEAYVEAVKSRHPDAKIVKAYERKTQVTREIHYRMY